MSFFHSLLSSSRGGYSIYPSSEKVILAGTDSVLDYITFGGLDINEDNIMAFAYRHGSDHNSTANADIKIIRSNAATAFDDIVWSSPISVVTQDGTNKYTNASVTFTHTGRTIVFYTSFAGTAFRLYYKYSDDFLTVEDVTTATWSAQMEMTTDYPPGTPNKFILGQGRAIEYNNILYKACHASTDGASNYEGPLYKSTDDGLTWTKVTNMYASSVKQYEEPCLDVLPSGRFVCLLRSNPDSSCSIITSDDLGATWTSPVEVFDSHGKNGLAINPNTNTILAFGRDPSTYRTIYGWAKNGGTGEWTSDFADGRLSAYMYGDPRWHPGLNGFISVYTPEAYSGPTVPAQPQAGPGPTIAVMKLFKEQSSVVTPPNYYSGEYQDVIDFADSQNATLPEEALRDFHSDFIAGLKTDGIFAELDRLWVFIQNDVDLAAFSKHSFKNPWKILTLVASPTYGVQGYGFNGSSQYLDLGIAPSLMSKFTQNSASAFYYCASEKAADQEFDFGTGAGTFSTVTQETGCNPKNTSNNLVFTVNDSTLDTIPNTTSVGFYHLQRTTSTHKRVFKNGVQLGSDVARTSVGRSSRNVYVGAKNFANGAFRFSTRTVGIIGFGSGLSGAEADLYARFNTFKTAIGL